MGDPNSQTKARPLRAPGWRGYLRQPIYIRGLNRYGNRHTRYGRYSNSESLSSVEFANTYLESVYGAAVGWNAAAPPTDAAKGIALRQATMDWFEGQFQGAWRGSITNPTQYLSMPRLGLTDDERRIFVSNVIPERIKQAVCLVANDILINSTTVLPTGTNRSAVVTEETSEIGTLKKTTRWSPMGNPSDTSLTVYRAAEALVYPFAESGSSDSITVF